VILIGNCAGNSGPVDWIQIGSRYRWPAISENHSFGSRIVTVVTRPNPSTSSSTSTFRSGRSPEPRRTRYHQSLDPDPYIPKTDRRRRSVVFKSYTTYIWFEPPSVPYLPPAAANFNISKSFQFAIWLEVQRGLILHADTLELGQFFC